MREFERGLRHQVDHLLDDGTLGSFAYGDKQRTHRGFAPGRRNLHISARKVSDPAGELESPGSLLNKSSKSYALNLSGDFNVNDRHERCGVASRSRGENRCEDARQHGFGTRPGIDRRDNLASANATRHHLQRRKHVRLAL